MSNLADKEVDCVSVAAAAPTSRGGWRAVRSAVRWVATAALVAWLVTSTRWNNVGTALSTASVGWLFVAAGVYLTSQFASVARWKHLIRAGGFSHSYGRLATAYFEGMFVNVCLPTTIGGDVLKVLRIGGLTHKRIVTSTVIADRLSGLAALFALLGIGLVMRFDSGHATYLSALAAVMIGLMLLSGGWAWHRVRHLFAATLANSQNAGLQKIYSRASRLPASVRQLAKQTPWPRVLMWALVVQSLNVVAVMAAARAIGLSIPPATALVATTTVSLAAALPLSIAGLGVREASLPLLLAADGAPRDLAITLGLVWSFTVLAIGLLGGPIHFIEQRRARGTHPSPVSVDQFASRRAA